MSANQVAGGYKAAINNPNVSDEKKEELKGRLEDTENSGEVTTGQKDDSNKNEGNVIGGYKATLKNPNVGDEAKQHAKEVLSEHGVETDSK